MKLICKLVGVQDDDTFEMEMNGSESVATFKKLIQEKKKHEIHLNTLDELLLYLAKKKDQINSAWLDGDVLDALSSSQVASMCTRMHDTQRLNSPKLFGPSVWLGDGVVHVLVVISEVFPLQRIVVGASKEVQWQRLLKTLEWKEPNRLCQSSGKNWPYQGLSELANVVTYPLVGHYQAWQKEFYDKQTHSLFLVVSGPGTGKSRMLNEMKSLLCEAAKRSKQQDLVERMENAFVFNITFGGDTAAAGKLLDDDCPEFDTSYRML